MLIGPDRSTRSRHGAPCPRGVSRNRASCDPTRQRPSADLLRRFRLRFLSRSSAPELRSRGKRRNVSRSPTGFPCSISNNRQLARNFPVGGKASRCRASSPAGLCEVCASWSEFGPRFGEAGNPDRRELQPIPEGEEVCRLFTSLQVLRLLSQKLIFVTASTQRKEVIRCLMVQQGGRKGVFVGPKS